MPSQKFLHVHFTWNNPGDAEPNWHPDKAHYLAYGLEIAPSTNTPHLQGYLQLKDRLGASTIQRLFFSGVKVHLSEQYRKGSTDASIDYIKKDGAFKEFGKPVEKGERMDLNELRDQLMEEKTSIDDIILRRPQAYHQYGRTLEAIARVLAKKKQRANEARTCIWIHGPSGAGKTRWAREHYPNAYIKPKDGNWWDYYAQEKEVIVDECLGNIPWDLLLDITDRYPCMVPRRIVGPTAWMADTIIFTAEHPPKHYYSAEGRDVYQLERRLQIKHVSEL